jgi:hypothetical protein
LSAINPFESPDFVTKVAGLGALLEEVGIAMREVAEAAMAAQAVDVRERTPEDAEYEVAALFERLGPGNKGPLYNLAEAFEPDDEFTLEEAAAALRVPKGEVKARLMNIGRSLRSLGRSGPDLWDVTWDDEARVNTYQWDPRTHRAILRMVRG